MPSRRRFREPGTAHPATAPPAPRVAVAVTVVAAGLLAAAAVVAWVGQAGAGELLRCEDGTVRIDHTSCPGLRERDRDDATPVRPGPPQPSHRWHPVEPDGGDGASDCAEGRRPMVLQRRTATGWQAVRQPGSDRPVVRCVEPGTRPQAPPGPDRLVAVAGAATEPVSPVVGPGRGLTGATAEVGVEGLAATSGSASVGDYRVEHHVRPVAVRLGLDGPAGPAAVDLVDLRGRSRAVAAHLPRRAGPHTVWAEVTYEAVGTWSGPGGSGEVGRVWFTERGETDWSVRAVRPVLR